MSKLLRLGPKLKYPIIINKLLKKPGDKIQKQEPILQFKFTWKQKVGDPFGEEWEEDQITIVDWDSPADGSIKLWKVYEGMTITRDMPFVEIEESCPHSVQFAGLCGICGKDMTEVSWASVGDDTDHARIKMIHDQTALTVSESEASKAEEDLQSRLLKNRKLSLVVDLDQTIIHACIEPTVGEWQNDPTSPNYEAVKGVKSFQLNDDGPRGLTSGCSYYIKMRPGLESFLNKISELYELHVYTMGTRAYAMNIAKIVDPDKRLFGDRIISRDENGSITTKCLARLFPVNTKMVVIIDDRADVWPFNRPNLIKVVPYDFFLGVGDINSSFLPKRDDTPQVNPLSEQKETQLDRQRLESESNSVNCLVQAPTEVRASNEEEKKSDEEMKTKVDLKELVGTESKKDQEILLEQTVEQEKILEKQLNERPLLHMQEKLDKEEDFEGRIYFEKLQHRGSESRAYHRQNLLKDDDMELVYLEKHLIKLHKSFYDEYDKAKALFNSRSGQLFEKDLYTSKKYPADLDIVPDIGEVIPRLKAKTFEGCRIVTSGLVPLQTDIMKTELGIQAISFGAKIMKKVNKNSTHLVAPNSRTRTNKVKQAAKYPHIKIVNQDWLFNSISKWEKEDEEPYLLWVHIHDEDRRVDCNLPIESSRASAQSSDDSDSSLTGDESEDTTTDSRGEIIDEENVMPSKMDDGYSPIDDLKGFDWDKVDDELAEFMGEEDSENDSDASEYSARLNGSSATFSKRKHEDIGDSVEEGNQSNLAKRQKFASERRTGLNSVDTPLSQENFNRLKLGENDAMDNVESNQKSITEDIECDTDGEADLEALLMAEFEKEEPTVVVTN
ncbi:RNA polymerase II subunit A C-terminal domain phosphatase [Podosphaera aphanis]|nr:RNA polymerase II subunit A C-terminal domain phosphatase [Podosphaera aphanis]